MHAGNFKCFSIRALLVLLLCLVASAPALAANPAIWKAHDNDTTVYFFGTVHIMKKGDHWHFAALDKAIADSSMLYTEIADGDPETVRPLVMKYGLDRAHPLSDQLDKDEVALLKKAAEQTGIPGGIATLNMMKPWLAAVTIATAPILKAGFDPKLGVDKQLQAQFRKAGKPVKGLETAKKQILIFSDLPQSVQLAMLRNSLDDYAHADELVNKLMQAWNQGDTATISQIVNNRVKKRSPALYKAVIIKRNQSWAKQISQLMKTQTGTILIAVGAGHLAGPDRLQLQLKQKGIDVTRVNP